MYSVRTAVNSDLDFLTTHSMALASSTEQLRLEREVVSSGIRRLLDDPSIGFALIAEDHRGLAVGQMIVGGSEWSDWSNGLYWWITSFTYSPKHDGKQVFQSLLYHLKVLAESSDRNVIGLRAGVLSNNGFMKELLPEVGMFPNQYNMFQATFSENKILKP